MALPVLTLLRNGFGFTKALHPRSGTDCVALYIRAGRVGARLEYLATAPR